MGALFRQLRIAGTRRPFRSPDRLRTRNGASGARHTRPSIEGGGSGDENAARNRGRGNNCDRGRVDRVPVLLTRIVPVTNRGGNVLRPWIEYFVITGVLAFVLWMVLDAAL